jgi:hypothetical protein
MAGHDFINPQLTQAIEDAILFGHIREIDAVLDLIDQDKNFPEEMRYGLQALRYFRAHYGKQGDMEPKERLQKQKAMVMENAWGAELLDKLRREEKIVALKKA